MGPREGYIGPREGYMGPEGYMGLFRTKVCLVIKLVSVGLCDPAAVVTRLGNRPPSG